MGHVPGTQSRTIAVVNAASATTTRNGAAPPDGDAGDRQSRGPGVQHQLRAGREGLRRNESGQQHDRQQRGDPLHPGPFQQGLRHREPGQFEQVAAQAARRQRCAIHRVIDARLRCAGAADRRPPRPARRSAPGNRPARTAPRPAPPARRPGRRPGLPAAQPGRQQRQKGGRQRRRPGPSNRGSDSQDAPTSADGGADVPEHEHADPGGVEAEPGGPIGVPADRHGRRLVDHELRGQQPPPAADPSNSDSRSP